MRVTRHAYAVDGWGVGELWEADGRLVVAHEAPMGVAREVQIADGPAEANFVSDLLRRFRAFYGGERVDFTDVGLDLEWCTPFQADVAAALQRVPWGELVSYGELAAIAGYPRAHRAVGTFCAGNRFSLLLPCHRVVAENGIGWYGPDGIATKRRLLRLEGHAAL